MGVRDEAPMWDDIPTLVELGWFAPTVTNLIAVKQEKAILEAKEKELALEVESALALAGIKRVRWSDHYCIEQGAGRSPSKLDPKLLAAAGVSADVIAAATISGKPYTYVQAVDMTKQKGGAPGADAE